MGRDNTEKLSAAISEQDLTPESDEEARVTEELGNLVLTHGVDSKVVLTYIDTIADTNIKHAATVARNWLAEMLDATTDQTFASNDGTVEIDFTTDGLNIDIKYGGPPGLDH